MPYASHLGVLLQKPHKWTSRHRHLLQVAEEEASSERIVGSTYLPQDGDSEFEAFAADFAKPTRENFFDGTMRFEEKYRTSPFGMTYNHMSSVIRQEEMGEHMCKRGYISLSRCIMESLVDTLLAYVDLDTWFMTIFNRQIPFHIHSCNVKGFLKPVGVLGRRSEIEDKVVTLPAATFTVIKPNESSDTIVHEIPQVLIQAISKLQKYPVMDAHTAFALRTDQFKLQLSSAVISRNYINDLTRGDRVIEGPILLRSAAYDLREPDQRREILRLLIGLLRHLDAEKLAPAKPCFESTTT